MSRSSTIGAATLGHLRRAGQLLEVHCACSRVSRIDTTQVEGWPDAVAVPECRHLLRCSSCGKRPTLTRPSVLVPGVDGKYPEHRR